MLSSCSSKGASHVNNKNTSISEVAMVIVISMGVVVDMLPAAWVSVNAYTCCIFQTSYHVQCTHVHLSCMCQGVSV